MIKNTCIPIVFLLCFFTIDLIGQCTSEGSIFINEIGNVTVNTNQEYVELVVVGDSEDPSAMVNLENWIIDDNNAPAIYVGNESGHIRLGPCFSEVAPGTIIVIYNDADLPFNINPINDGVFEEIRVIQMPISNDCILKYGKCPTRYNASYDCSPGPDVNDFYGFVSIWNEHIPMRTIGDALQVLTPEGELVHALYWSEDNFPGAGASVSVNFPTKNASGNSFQFVGGEDWYNANEYLVVNNEGSPGTYNSPANQALIDRIKSGEISGGLDMSCTSNQPAQEGQSNGTITIDIGSGVPSFEIEGTSSAGNFALSIGEVGETTIDDLGAGEYTITVTDENGCSASCEVTINAVQIAEGCAGLCQEIGEDLPNDVCYYWDTEYQFEDNTQKMQVVCPEESTSYSVTITDDDGNLSVEEVQVNILEIEMNEPEKICPGESATISVTVTGGNGNYNYIWSNGATTPSITVSPIETTSYTVTISASEPQECTVIGESEVQILDFEDIESYRAYLESENYKSIVLDDLIYTPYENIGEVVEEYAQMVIEKDGNIINVNEDIGGFLNNLSNHLSVIKGKIKYFDEESLNCEDLVLRSSKNNSKLEKFLLNEEYIYYVEVIATVAADGSKMLHVQLTDNLTYKEGNGINTIYLVPVDISLDMEIVRSWVRYYYDLIYCLPDDNNGNCDYESNLNIEVISSIDQNDLDDKDAISFIGNSASDIINLVAGDYCNLMSDGFYERSAQYFLKGNDVIVEQGDAWGRRQLSYVRTDVITQEDVNSHKCESAENLLGFLIFHATGHNAGIVHSPGAINNGQGYMQEGPCITWNLGKYPSTCASFPDPEPYESMLDLILATPQHIFNKIKERYE